MNYYRFEALITATHNKKANRRLHLFLAWLESVVVLSTSMNEKLKAIKKTIIRNSTTYLNHKTGGRFESLNMAAIIHNINFGPRWRSV